MGKEAAMTRIIALLALGVLGCAVDVDADHKDAPEAPAAPSAASDAPRWSSPGLSCGPIFDENLEIVGWNCLPPTAIDPGCDFSPARDESQPPEVLESPLEPGQPTHHY
jgi:hypothetical protein